ncbi:MAG: M28 family peptidase [Bacteroidota bacterium]
MMKGLWHKILIALCCLPGIANAQDLDYARSVVKELCSPDMYGRGYVKDGQKKAAGFIKEELKASKLSAFNGDYFQTFAFQVNSFPYKVQIVVDNQSLIPGEHFIVSPGCPPVNGTYEMIWIDSACIDNAACYQKLEKRFLRNTFLVLNDVKDKQVLYPERLKNILTNQLKAKGLIHATEKKLTWSVATEWDPFVQIYVLNGFLKPYQTSIKLTIEPDLKGHNTQNVIAFQEGSKYKDSFVVFTAHYDHLGMMGEAVFPGANDNASGVAMLLDLVKYYAKNKPEFSVAFIFFSAEEAGLFGSYYYTEHPLFPLKKISLLLNLDLMGTGDKGMTVVNATLFPEEFRNLQMTNLAGDYLPTVNSRGTAKNSDHYYFTENGVKAFFFYLMGDYHFYHDVDDKAEALPFSRYNETFRLITQFVKEYQTGH